MRAIPPKTKRTEPASQHRNRTDASSDPGFGRDRVRLDVVQTGGIGHTLRMAPWALRSGLGGAALAPCARCGSRFSAGAPGPAAWVAAGAGGPGEIPVAPRAQAFLA
jgi:hypothetical protein